MFKHIIGALERIQFQHKSVLFKDISELCQSVLDEVNVLKVNTSVLQESTKHVLFKLDFKEKITKLIYTHLKLQISDVVIEVADDVNAAIGCNFILPKIAKLIPMKNKNIVSSVNSLKDDWTKLVEDLPVNADNTKGVLLTSIDNMYACRLYITTGAFTLSKLYGNIEQITGAEVAAVIMHELGHAMTFLESFCLVVQKTIQVKQFIDTIDQKISGAELKEFIVLLTKQINRIEDKTTKAMFAEILLFVHQQTELTKDNALAVYVITLVSLCFIGIFFDNDVLVTNLSKSHFERITDEFMAQHGAAVAFTSMFVKLYSAIERGRSQKMIDIMSSYKVIGLMVDKLNFIKNVFSSSIIVGHSSYDELIRRLKLNIQNTTENLKDVTISSELRNDLIAIIKQAKEIISEYESRNYVKAREVFWKSLLRIARPGTTMDALKNGNLAADYQRLQEITKDMVQSPFSYHVARLKTLQESQTVY